MQPQKNFATNLCYRKTVQSYEKKMKNTNYSVKKHQTYRLLFLVLLISGTLQARNTNYVGAYLEGGGWALMPSGSKYGPSLGAAGSLGALYELQSGNKVSETKFLFDVGLGVHGGWTRFDANLASKMAIENATDMDGDSFDYVYEITSRKDAYLNVAAQVPLLIGVQHRRFYMLAGVKANVNVFTRFKSTATLNTYGDYYRFTENPNFAEFRNMPEQQFFENMPLTTALLPTKWNLDVDLHLEFGGRLGFLPEGTGFEVPRRDVEYRLAAFVDYGLLDLHIKGNNPLAEAPTSYDAASAYNPDGTNTSMIQGIKLNDVFTTSGFANAVKDATIGIKFTILFQIHQPEKCVLCGDGYKSLVPARGRKGGVQYEE